VSEGRMRRRSTWLGFREFSHNEIVFHPCLLTPALSSCGAYPFHLSEEEERVACESANSTGFRDGFPRTCPCPTNQRQNACTHAEETSRSEPENSDSGRSLKSETIPSTERGDFQRQTMIETRRRNSAHCRISVIPLTSD
jgi:hypothetical protein